MIVFWVSIISLLWTSSVRVNQTICLVFINTYSPVIKPTGHYHTCVSPQTPCTCRSRLVRAHYQGDQEYNLQRPHWPPPQLHLQRDQHKERERRGGRTLKSVHICLKVVRIQYVNCVTFLSCVLWSLSSQWASHVSSFVLLCLHLLPQTMFRSWENRRKKERDEVKRRKKQDMCFFNIGTSDLLGNEIWNSSKTTH